MRPSAPAGTWAGRVRPSERMNLEGSARVMASGDGRRRTDVARIVVAAITHVSDRVLAIQRVDDDAWLLPGGPVASGEDIEVRLRQYVRDATGFELRHLTSLGRHPGADGVVEFIRCEIRGVGPDITFRTRTMRWMDRDAIAALMDPIDARGMLDALDAGGGTPTDIPSRDASTLLAS